VEGARLVVAGMALSLVLLEVLWARWFLPRAYDLRDTACNLAIMVVGTLLKPVTLIFQYALLEVVAPFRLLELPTTTLVFAVTFIVTDFAYYWYHRWSHEVPPLWALHHVHHSSPWLNLTTAVRLSWVARFVAPFYFVCLGLLGLPPEFVTVSLGIGLLYQFPLHTQAVGRLGWFEGRLLNTPSAHRVHHGSNSRYVDRNYAGVLIVWDVLFGTYEPEASPVRYGVRTGFVGHNPVTVQFQPLARLLQGRWQREQAVDAGPERVERLSSRID
jgi:sterol desaturase/sphingolipid hydroxylase (fatty acid hydroxylase superfamily)